MNSFPLYNNLIKNISHKDLTKKQKEEFIRNIEQLDDNTKELIYVLITFYYNENNQPHALETIPYGGLKTPTTTQELYNISWNMEDIPVVLRQILYKFICLHQKQKNEIKREISTRGL